MGTPKVYDYILENGTWVGWSHHQGEPGSAFRDSRIEHVLPLSAFYRWPLIGILLRHHWAKKRGAAFD